MNTDKIFDSLSIFKNFPTYQLERRIDAFMLPFLENGIRNTCGINDGGFVFVYPEFPIKRLPKRGVPDESKIDCLSEYVDYLMYSPAFNTVYFVEFKTEVKSIKGSQFQSYNLNCQQGWSSLIEYYFDKAINSKSWRKFVYGLIHIEKVAPRLLGNVSLDLEKFLQYSKGVHKKLLELKNNISIKEDEPAVKFIYLALTKSKEVLDKIVHSHQCSSEYYVGLITLNRFADFVSDKSLKELLRQIDSK